MSTFSDRIAAARGTVNNNRGLKFIATGIKATAYSVSVAGDRALDGVAIGYVLAEPAAKQVVAVGSKVKGWFESALDSVDKAAQEMDKKMAEKN